MNGTRTSQEVVTDILRLSDRLAVGVEAGESQFREFKSACDYSASLPAKRDVKAICTDIAETLVAFANADGGELWVGVEDDGTVVGVPHKEDLIRMMLSAPRTHVHERTPLQGVSASRLLVEGKLVLYFQTSRGTERVHLTCNGRCLQRFDTENRPVSAEDIQYSRQERTSQECDRCFVDGASLADLDCNLIARVSKRIAGGQSPEKFLQYFDLAVYSSQGLSLRRAALLLFAKDISNWHPRCQIRIARVAGAELGYGKGYNISGSEDHIIRGNILRILETAWETLRPYLARTRLAQAGVFTESLVYPEDACLEGLVNAVAHRDYSIEGKGIEILVFENRLEISSPGGLLASISLADLKTGKRTHQSRNVHVSRILRELGYMREMGEGMLRIFATMRDRDLVPPEIQSSPTIFELVLHHESIFSPRDQEWLSAFAPYALTRDEQRVVLMGRDGSLLSTNEIIGTLNIADVDEFRQLVERLRRKGILYNAKPRRGGGVKNRSDKRWAVRPPDQVDQYRAELIRILLEGKTDVFDPALLRSIASRLAPSNPYKEKLAHSLKLLGLVDERLRPLPALLALTGSRAGKSSITILDASDSIKSESGGQLGKIRALKSNGYGFIEDAEGQEYFFHVSDLISKEEWDRMRLGNTVEFTAGVSPKGPVAKNVRIVS